MTFCSGVEYLLIPAGTAALEEECLAFEEEEEEAFLAFGPMLLLV